MSAGHLRLTATDSLYTTREIVMETVSRELEAVQMYTPSSDLIVSDSDIVRLLLATVILGAEPGGGNGRPSKVQLTVGAGSPRAGQCKLVGNPITTVTGDSTTSIEAGTTYKNMHTRVRAACVR